MTSLMRVNHTINVFLALCLLAAKAELLRAQSPGPADYGPEVRSFLDLCRHEETELDFQIKHNEISREDYVRAKNRIAVHREAVLRIVRQTGADVVPELHVVTASEVDALIENGARLLKTIRSGAVIADKWRYKSRVIRGETFYVFERIARE